MRTLLLTSAALAAGLAVPAHAQQTVETLDEVVVTSTRLPAIVADTPGARVFDSTVIEKRGAVFASDLLADVPGLSVTRTGAFGGVAHVRMRGAAPGKTLVLIDGAPVNDSSEINGAFDFSTLELGDVERMEVLSGPQSSLWGSDAIGGVISFTTREIEGLRADAEVGSYGTARGRVSAGIANETWALGAYVSRFENDGISAADEADGNTEADGVENTTVGVRGRYAFNPQARIEGVFRWTDALAHVDGFPAPTYTLRDTADTTDSKQWNGFSRLTLQGFGLSHQFSVSASEIERVNRGSYGSTFSGDRQVYRWQADGAATHLTYAFGAEVQQQQGHLASGLSTRLGTSSVFGVSRYDKGALSVTGGLRYDETDDFGGELTGRLSAAYDLPNGFILSGAFGTGFKAPSVSQALCDYCRSSNPFPQLRAETADSVEVAIGWASADGRIDGRATLYRLNIEDQISYFSDASWNSYYINIAETRTDGFELEGRALLGGGFDLVMAYAWTDARDETTGVALLRVPEHAGSATLGWTGDRLSGALTVRAEGDMPDSGGERESFVTANLNAAYQLNDTVTLTARIENLADRHYQQALGYGEPGRSGYVGIKLRY